jgi:hypothetical protein
MSAHEPLKMDFFELGDKTSIVCADAVTTETVRATLRDLGYKSHAVESPEMAVERLRYTAYDVIAVQENFAGSSLLTNPVLAYLAPLPMAQRRNSFVVLIGPSFKTLDAMQAFTQSVHVVVNPMDLLNLAAILKKSIAEFELQYKVFKDSMASQGQR